MAKTREQVIQEQLGAMAFQIAVLVADLDAAHERITALTPPAPVASRGETGDSST